MKNFIFLSGYFQTSIKMAVAVECASKRRILIEKELSILLVFPVGGAKSDVYTYLLIVQPFMQLETSR